MLLLAPALAGDAETEFLTGFVLGGGRSSSQEATSPSWTATVGGTFRIHQGVLYLPMQFGVLIARLPPGGLAIPDFGGGVGVAPWGKWGPHVAAQVGVGFGLTVVQANYGAVAGVGIGPVSLDARIRRGWRFPSTPNPWTLITGEISFVFPTEI